MILFHQKPRNDQNVHFPYCLLEKEPQREFLTAKLLKYMLKKVFKIISSKNLNVHKWWYLSKILKKNYN